MNIALVGSNFGIKGYLPAINKIKSIKLKIICSRNIKKLKNIDLSNVTAEKKLKLKLILLI